jgi:hypothetical protein
MSGQPTDQIKGQLGTVATVVWLIGGVLAFVLDRGFGSLISLRALLFLGVGMFVAAIVAGLATYKMFLHLADRAAMAPGATDPRQAVMRALLLSYGICAVLSALLVIGAYITMFRS